jgi:hypothetical protein
MEGGRMKGTLNEDLIVAKIEKKCDIKTNPTYDHQYKLDFIVDRFKSIDKLIPIGVQVTIRLNNTTKQKIFLTERKKKTLVDKSIYIEVHPDVDITNWGSELIYNALVSFVFQKKLVKEDIVGLRINPDTTYEFFNIEENIKSARKSTQKSTGKILKGKIVRYFPDKGYGFIETKDTSRWFFHISKVSDNRLTDSFLPNAQINQDDNTLIKPIYVEFEDNGHTRGQDDSPEAINIKLSISRT